MFSVDLINKLKVASGSGTPVSLQLLAGDAKTAFTAVAPWNVYDNNALIENSEEDYSKARNDLAKWLRQASLEFETYNAETKAGNSSQAFKVLYTLHSTVTQVANEAKRVKMHVDRLSDHQPTDIGSIVPGTPEWGKQVLAKLDQLLSR